MVPSWAGSATEALEQASASLKPLVVYFPDEANSDFQIYGDEFVQLASGSAVFVKMAYTADREKTPWEGDSVVPVNKLTAANPALEYKIAVGKATLLVCDWFGNEIHRLDNGITSAKVKSLLTGVKKKVAAADKKLARNYDKAKQANDASDTKKALRFIMSNFREGLVGLPAQENTVRLYHDILDAGRTEMNALLEKSDQDGLKKLATTYRNTALEKEIADAIANPKTGRATDE